MAALMALPALQGCVGTRPAIPAAARTATPPGWRFAAAPAGPIEADWWRGFGDPRLTELVEQALARNTDIAIAASRVEEARALARLAQAQQTPNATIGAGTGESRTVVLGKGVDAFAGTPQASISYDLDLFRRLASATASARASLLAASDTKASVMLAVASTAASSYISLLGLDARLATTRATLASRADALRLAQRRAGAGYTSKLELAQAQSEYDAAAQLVPVAELAIARQENALSILVGDAPGAIARSARLEGLTTPVVPGDLPSDVLRRRPDIAAAEETLVASDHSLDSARAAMLPNVSLTGSGGVGLSTALSNPISLFAFGGSVLSPLFDGGRLRSQAGAAAARRDQAAFAYRRTVLTAFREVEDSLAAVDRLDAQRKLVDNQVAALTETLRYATNRYREGYAPYLDQIDAQRNLLAAQLVAIQVETDRLNAVVTLYQAMGGGWRPADEPPFPIATNERTQ
ncbi:efflux transporter outer membrane subunit [Sphingobium amiense]|nr:efflux transporter outer membrane subunit [Sphingobium amiense]